MPWSMLFDFVKYLGLTTLPFTLHFAWKKIGYRVAASYTWAGGPFIAFGIGSVTLINLKDRPLAIFGIYAVMDGLSFKLKEFNPPLIVKAMEATTIEADQVTKRRLGSKVYDWKPPAGKSTNIDIFLATATKTVKCCRQEMPPSEITFAMNRRLKPVYQETHLFNGLPYNDNARFAITYIEDKSEKTALVDITGIIHWGYAFNRLSSRELQSVDAVKDAIIRSGLSRLISPFAVDDLRELNPSKQNPAAIHREPITN